MNKDRRVRLEKIISALEELQADIESIRDEEQEAFDNMPESLQNGDRGMNIQEAISNMENADLSDAISCLQDAAL